MQTRIPSVFKVSVLAAAMVTLSGCAVTSEPSRIGESIMSAGRITADASVKAYEGTKRILGFDRLERSSADVDMALMDADSVFPSKNEQVAVAMPVDSNSALRVEPLGGSIDGIDQPPLGAPAIATIPAIDPNAIPVATIDYNHSVGANETMWTIAKTTTGNANNWRILAEINQLDINTPMQIGQEILVPADLVLPELVAGLAPQTVVPSAADEQVIGGTLEPIAVADLISSPIPEAGSEGLVLGASNEEIITEDALNDETLVLAAADLPTEEPVLAAPTLDPSVGAIALKADAGETLWDMAKRTTGDALNWKKIAEQNNFTEQDIGRIRYGQTIYVPVEMAKAELGGEKPMIAKASVPATDPKKSAVADAKATDQLIAATTPAAQPSNQEAVDASSALVASASNLLDETQDIKIVEAKFQSDQTIVAEPADVNAAGQVIMVSGTYYPKAVYNEADFSSSLLMRVSPGTEMTVTRAMGPWFEVQTEFGTGYMHARDIR